MAEPLLAPASAAKTVTELTLSIRETLAGEFGEVWVRGQLTGLRRASSGHVYFSMKDEGAVLPAVVWRTLAARLRFDLEDGLDVLCRGTIDVYPPHGKYQLIVHEAQPLGLGALQIAFEKMKRRLEAEGLFAPERKIAIPFLPRRVALVTSKTGAAVRDLVTVIHRRFPRIEIVLVAVRVQGAGSADEIARGLAFADARARADVIVVGRGGGSAEDLWAFNEEVVARAIAACATPVVSAVGHETDVTIADFVADVRAATPSQAGELVVPVRADLLLRVDEEQRHLTHRLRVRLERAWQRVEAPGERPVLRDPRGLLAPRRRAVEHAAQRLRAASPRAALERRGEVLRGLRGRADAAMRGRTQAAHARLLAL